MTFSASKFPFRAVTLAALLGSLPLAASAQTSAGGTPPPGGAPPSTAPAATPRPLTGPDKKFVKDASSSLFYLLDLLKAAKTAASGEATKKVFENGNKELTSAWEGVAKISTAKNEKLVTELSGSDKQNASKLKKLPADKFDKEFLKDYSKELKKLASTYEAASKSVQDQDIKAYTLTWAPTLATLLAEADKAESEAGKRK
jgi:uncharacterized protein DUF4142